MRLACLNLLTLPIASTLLDHNLVLIVSEILLNHPIQTPMSEELQEYDEIDEKMDVNIRKKRVHVTEDEEEILKQFYMEKSASGYSRSEIEPLFESATGIQPPRKTKMSELYDRWGACGRKKPKLDSSTLYDVVAKFTIESGGLLGYREITARIREAYRDHFISRDSVAVMSSLQNPEAAQRRIPRGLKHPCVFTCPGPGYLFAIDGYDKLRSYGFDIHIAVDGATRFLH